MSEIYTISESELPMDDYARHESILNSLGASESVVIIVWRMLRKGNLELDIPYSTLEITKGRVDYSVRHSGKAIRTEAGITSSVLCRSYVSDNPSSFFEKLGYQKRNETRKEGIQVFCNSISVFLYTTQGKAMLELSSVCSPENLDSVYTAIQGIKGQFLN